MINTTTPNNGDFASYLEGKSQSDPAATIAVDASRTPADDQEDQTIADVLLGGEEPTEELLDQLRVLEDFAPLSDEELERQALNDPGADGDVTTPE